MNAWNCMDDIQDLAKELVEWKGTEEYLKGCAERILNIARAYMMSDATVEGQELLSKEWGELP